MGLWIAFTVETHRDGRDEEISREPRVAAWIAVTGLWPRERLAVPVAENRDVQAQPSFAEQPQPDQFL